jgi:hypothetical protein
VVVLRARARDLHVNIFVSSSARRSHVCCVFAFYNINAFKSLVCGYGDAALKSGHTLAFETISLVPFAAAMHNGIINKVYRFSAVCGLMTAFK